MAERIDVFVSSTSRDLAAYRDAVLKVILRLGLYPITMEAFNPTHRNALQLCYDKVQEAEIFVGIYAYRYGYVPGVDMTYLLPDGTVKTGDGETGITHLEYLWALERNLPMLLFVISDTDADGYPLSWPVAHIEDEPGKARLIDFKRMIMSKHVVGDFRTPDNLATQVATGLADIIGQLQSIGKQYTPIKPNRRDFYKHIPLPPNYIPRTDLLAELRLALLGYDSVALTSAIQGATALHGMGGIGKSVMARALCDDPAVQAAFPDGILWTTLGQEPTLTVKLREWVTVLGGTIGEHAPTEDTLKAKLARLLDDRACLLIIDDVWQKRHAEAFHLGGVNCRLLLTTRDAEVARGIGVDVKPIPTMSTSESLELLQEWAGGSLDNAAEETLTTIINRLGRLPLAIKLAGAQLQRKSPEKWLERFDARKLKAKRPEHVHDSLELTFGLSLDELEINERRLYAALAIFREDEPIREVAIHRLWSALEDVDGVDAEDLLDDLAARLLLEVVGKEYPRATILHDLLRGFMSSELEDPTVVHKALIDAYRETRLDEGWHTAPDDGYLHDNLIYHLKETNAYEEIEELFLTSNWMEARLQASGYTFEGYINDLQSAHSDYACTQANSQLISNNLTSALLCQCLRYFAIRACVNSIAGSYSPKLICIAVKYGLWSFARAISTIARFPDPIEQINAILLLLKHFKLRDDESTQAQRLFSTAIDQIDEEEYRIEYLVELYCYVKDNRIKQIQYSVEYFLEKAVQLDESKLARILELILVCIKPNDLSLTAQAIGSLSDEATKAKLIRFAVECQIDSNTVFQLLESVLDEYHYSSTIAEMVGYLNEEEVFQILEATKQYDSDSNKLRVLHHILRAPYPVLHSQARAAIRAISDTKKSASAKLNVLSTTIPFLNVQLRSQWAEEIYEVASNQLEPEQRLRAFVEIAPYLERPDEAISFILLNLSSITFYWEKIDIVCKIAHYVQGDNLEYLMAESFKAIENVPDEATKISLLSRIIPMISRSDLYMRYEEQLKAIFSRLEHPDKREDFLFLFADEEYSQQLNILIEQEMQTRIVLERNLASDDFAEALQMNSGMARVQRILKFVSQLDDEDRKVALSYCLEDSLSIEDPENKAKALSMLTPHLQGYNKALALARAIEAASVVTDERFRERLLNSLNAQMQEIPLPYAFGSTLSNLEIVGLTKPRTVTFDAAIAIKKESTRYNALKRLIPDLTDNQREQVLKHIVSFSDPKRTLTLYLLMFSLDEHKENPSTLLDHLLSYLCEKSNETIAGLEDLLRNQTIIEQFTDKDTHQNDVLNMVNQIKKWRWI